MREFKKRRSARGELLNFSIRLCGTLVLLIVTIAAATGAWDMYLRLRTASEGRTDAETQLQDLKNQEAHVSASIDQLSSARGQEALMRERYGVAKPGEGVVQIVHQAPTSTPANGGRGWFGQLLRTLFSW